MKESNMGRPMKYKNVEELQTLIDKYFKDCIEKNEPQTITGLAIALDTTRDLLCDYEEKPNFSDTIKKAKQRIKNEYEKRLIKRGNAGDIFAMKNFGWTDRQVIDQTVTTKSLKETLEDL